MKYKLSVRKGAEQDLGEAYDFYEAQRPALGDEFHDEIAQVLRKIEHNPLLYQESEVRGYRKAVLTVFPFCIYYAIYRDLVMIVAVHDSRRDPKHWKDRTKKR